MAYTATFTRTEVTYTTESEREAFVNAARSVFRKPALEQICEGDQKKLVSSLEDIAEIVGYFRFLVFNGHLAKHVSLKDPRIDDLVEVVFGGRTEYIKYQIYYDGKLAFERSIEKKNEKEFNYSEIVAAVVNRGEGVLNEKVSQDQLRILGLGIALLSDTREKAYYWDETRGEMTSDQILEQQGLTSELAEELRSEFSEKSEGSHAEATSEFNSEEGPR